MIVKQFQVSVDKVSCAHQIMLRMSLLIVTSFWCININGLPVSVSNSVPKIEIGFLKHFLFLLSS